jgi:cation:H+ antiporter
VEIATSIVLLLVGLAVAIVASDVAVSYTRALAAGLGAPPFVVGVVLVAIGTDLPEIANSIAAHAQGEGDVNVGDSIGSTLTQYTLVLALFPLVIPVIAISRRQVGLVTALTMGGLALTTFAVADGWLSRLDGAALVLSWAVATIIVTRVLPGHAPDDPPRVRLAGHGSRIAVVLSTLVFVGVGATVAVRSLVTLAEAVGIPEFALAFFGASLGTSAPEVAVDITALRQGAPAIALGDALGSSLIDATLSIGIGPLFFPAAVTASLAVTGALYTLAAVGLVGALLVWRRRHDRVSAVALFGLYLLSYVIVLSAGTD